MKMDKDIIKMKISIPEWEVEIYRKNLSLSEQNRMFKKLKIKQVKVL